MEESNESEESEFILFDSLERSEREQKRESKDDMFSLGGLKSLQAMSEEVKVCRESPLLSLQTTHNSDQFSKQTDFTASLPMQRPEIST